jgi:hypothetical protein
MAKKRRNKKQRRQEAAGHGYTGAWADNGRRGAGGMDTGFYLPGFGHLNRNEQFLLGALVGAGAAWILSDEELRGRIMKAGMKLYAGLVGGFEEMKEQMADIRAELEAEQHGGV